MVAMNSFRDLRQECFAIDKQRSTIPGSGFRLPKGKKRTFSLLSLINKVTGSRNRTISYLLWNFAGPGSHSPSSHTSPQKGGPQSQSRDAHLSELR